MNGKIPVIAMDGPHYNKKGRGQTLEDCDGSQCRRKKVNSENYGKR